MRMDKHDIDWGDSVRLLKTAYSLPQGTIGVFRGLHEDIKTLAYVQFSGKHGNSLVKTSRIERISVHKYEPSTGDQLMLLKEDDGRPAGHVVKFLTRVGGIYVAVEDETTHDVFTLPYTNLMVMMKPQEVKPPVQSLREALVRTTKILTGL